MREAQVEQTRTEVIETIHRMVLETLSSSDVIPSLGELVRLSEEPYEPDGMQGESLTAGWIEEWQTADTEK